jgi:peptidoglycan/LPS O-acetylase OafA/YrhL
MIGGSMPALAWLSAILYGANYFDLYVMFAPLPSGVPSPLTHLWSLAVEEHFYILWPICLVALQRRGWVAATLAGLCLAILAWRSGLYHLCFIGDAPGPSGGVCGERVEYRLYKATDTRLDSIAWGALIAALAAGRARSLLEHVLASRLVQGLALAVLMTGFVYRNTEFREVWRYSLQGLSLCVLIPAVSGADSLVRRLFEHDVIVWVGRLSYSLYLWHWAGVSFADWAEPGHGTAWVIRATCLTITGALISYYAIERPMIALRRRAGSHARV